MINHRMEFKMIIMHIITNSWQSITIVTQSGQAGPIRSELVMLNMCQFIYRCQRGMMISKHCSVLLLLLHQNLPWRNYFHWDLQGCFLGTDVMEIVHWGGSITKSVWIHSAL